MSKLQEKIEQYKKEAKKLNLGLSESVIEKATKGLGPSIYKRDSETVSCSNKDELDRVKKNFIQKKLGIHDDAKADAAIKKVCEKMGSSNRNKYRALFYALIAKELGKEDIYA